MKRRIIFLLIVFLLTACRAPWDAEKAAQAKADAAQMMQCLQKSDIHCYREYSVPPEQLKHLKTEWPAWRALFALEKSQQAGFEKMLTRFTEKNAEAYLQRDMNAKLKAINGEIDRQWPLMQASLTLLMQGWVSNNEQFSEAEKAHANALIRAIIEQMPASWLQDKALRKKAFVQMVDIARATKIQNYAQIQNLQYAPFNRKLGEVLDGLKKLGEIYGLNWDAGQKFRQIEVISQSGDTTVVRIRYPVGKKWVEFTMELIEQNGHWYDASAKTLIDTHLADR